MKKSLVAVLLVGLAGVAAAGVGVHRLSNGCCPLTGQEINCKRAAPAAVAMPETPAPAALAAGSHGLASLASPVSEGSEPAVSGCPLEQCKDQPICPAEQAKRCCGQKRDCDTAEKKSEPAAKPSVE